MWNNVEVVHMGAGTEVGATWPREDRAVSTSLRRIFPEPATDVTVAEAYKTTTRRGGLDDEPPPLGADAGSGRPWVMSTMVSSLDGGTAVAGRSGPLGNTHDSEILLATRALADVIIVGAETARAEGYGPPSDGQRIGVVSHAGNVDASSPLFTSGAGFLIVPDNAPPTEVPALRAGYRTVDLATALARLDEIVPGVETVQCEGGPHLNASLVDAGCIDELNLTVSPRIVGGTADRVVADAATTHIGFELVQLVTDDEHYLFSRWRRRRPDPTLAP